MTRKILLSTAGALAFATLVSGCGRVDSSEYTVQVPMSEASYQNLYGAYANGCDGAGGENCASN